VPRQAVVKLASQAKNYAGKGAAICCTLRHAATKAHDVADISLLACCLASVEAASAEDEFSSPKVDVF
jgi:hypothetical protein